MTLRDPQIKEIALQLKRIADALTEKHSTWMRTTPAAEELGISTRSLFRMRESGTLPAGDCWRRTFPDNKNSDVLYNIPACLEVLNQIAKESAEVKEKCPQN